MSEFKFTKGKWNIITKGNTVKQLCIQVDDDNKVCGNISPKRLEDALLISKAPEMLEMLDKVRNIRYTGASKTELENLFIEVEQLIKEATE